MKYFAYGSNMSLNRLKARVPSAKRIGLFTLPGHKLEFHKQSRDGSGKCDAFVTDEPDAMIYGSLFEIDIAEKQYLDEVEGVGKGYDIKNVLVYSCDEKVVEAYTYIATDIVTNLKPYSWYLNHVLVGAREVGVPEFYLNKIMNTQSKEDKDHERSALNQALYE